LQIFQYRQNSLFELLAAKMIRSRIERPSMPSFSSRGTLRKRQPDPPFENEMSCNTERAKSRLPCESDSKQELHAGIGDPGNAAQGSTPYPTGYHLLPKERIGHCHCKDVVSKPTINTIGSVVPAFIDWLGI